MALTPAFEAWKEDANQVGLLNCARMFNAQLKRAGREWVGPCPVCGGKDTFAVNEDKQAWICRRGQGKGHDAVSLAMHAGQLSFSQACEQLAGRPSPSGRTNGLSDEDRARREAHRKQSEAIAQKKQADEEKRKHERLQTANGLWDASVPILGTLAETYLLKRGLPVPPEGWPDSLRFHPQVTYELSGNFEQLPCLVCRVNDAWGDITAVWRIFLNSKGDKANVGNAKVGMGPAAGGAVWLGGLGPKIATVEGVETGLAVRAIRGYDVPVHALLSTSGMVNWEPPPDVLKGVHYPDGDPARENEQGKLLKRPGITYAKAFKKRLEAIGRKWMVAEEPLPGVDYLDIWNAHQERNQG